MLELNRRIPHNFHMTRNQFQRAAEEAAVRRCDHPDCRDDGAYRAPISPSNLTEYYWFCLDHVRDYNKAWNFFEQMSDDEVEHFQRSDVTGHRPTWRLGLNGAAADGETIRDDLGVFDAAGFKINAEANAETAVRQLPPQERESLAELNLSPRASLDEIKTRYKELAKKYHPDLNGGDDKAGDRFKAVNSAYTYLMNCGYS